MKLLIFTSILILSISSLALEYSGIKITGGQSFHYLSNSNGVSHSLQSTTSPDNEMFTVDRGYLGFESAADRLSFKFRLRHKPRYDNNQYQMVNLDSLFVTYKLSPFDLQFGRLITNLGLESVNRANNYSYTDSYAFNFLTPFNSEGVRLGLKHNETWQSAISLYNRPDGNGYMGDDVHGSAVELSTGGETPKIVWGVGMIRGDMLAASNHVVELTTFSGNITFKVTELFQICLDYDASNWQDKTDASAPVLFADDKIIYFAYKFSPHNFALRYEDLNDKNHKIRSGNHEKINRVTLTDKIEVDPHMTVFAEYALTTADQDSFIKQGQPTKSESTVLVGSVVYF